MIPARLSHPHRIRKSDAKSLNSRILGQRRYHILPKFSRARNVNRFLVQGSPYSGRLYDDSSSIHLRI